MVADFSRGVTCRNVDVHTTPTACRLGGDDDFALAFEAAALMHPELLFMTATAPTGPSGKLRALLGGETALVVVLDVSRDATVYAGRGVKTSRDIRDFLRNWAHRSGLSIAALMRVAIVLFLRRGHVTSRGASPAAS